MRIKSLSDVDIVKRIQAGQVHYFDELADRYWQQIYKYLCGRLAPRNDAVEIAEDLTQDAFLRIFRAIDRYDPDHDRPLSVKNWMFLYVRSVFTGFLEKESREGKKERNEKELAKITDPNEPNPEDRARDQCVRQQLKKLKDEERELVLLYFGERFYKKDIATILQCNVRTVRRHIKALLPKVIRLFKVCL